MPIHLSNINEVLHMDREAALRNSPVQYAPAVHSPVSICSGGETKLLNSWIRAGNCMIAGKNIIPAEILEPAGLNQLFNIGIHGWISASTASPGNAQADEKLWKHL